MKPNDPKTMARLGDRIASLATAISVATHKLSAMIRRFDEAEGWRADGQQSCAEWLSFKTGMSMSTAYEQVRVARRLGQLPHLDEAFAAGKLSYCKVRALSRVADEHNEAKLVASAGQMSGAELELHCRGLRIKQHAFGQREAERYVRLRSQGDGTVKLEAVLSADEAELLQRALRQGRRQLAADDGGDSSAEESLETDPRDRDEQRDRDRAEALAHIARCFLSGAAEPQRSSGGDRAQLLVHLRVESQAEAEPSCGATLHDSGNWLSREAFERLSCDCSTTVAKVGRGGELLDVGRSRRTIPPAIRRALLVRDGCCVFPGCSNRLYLDAHHLEHWSRGGATKLHNLLTLCPAHHRLVHEGGWTIERDEAASVRFVAPDGRVVDSAAVADDGKPAAKKRRAMTRDTTRCDEPSGEEPWAGPTKRTARRSRSPASPRPVLGEAGRSVELAPEANPARPAPASSGNHARRRRPGVRAAKRLPAAGGCHDAP
jgi:hypothetical protein